MVTLDYNITTWQDIFKFININSAGIYGVMLLVTIFFVFFLNAIVRMEKKKAFIFASTSTMISAIMFYLIGIISEVTFVVVILLWLFAIYYYFEG